MTLIDQIQVAIVSHALEFGYPPNYVDVAPDVFAKMGLPREKVRMLGDVPVFSEPTCPRGSIQLINYQVDKLEPMQLMEVGVDLG